MGGEGAKGGRGARGWGCSSGGVVVGGELEGEGEHGGGDVRLGIAQGTLRQETRAEQNAAGEV